MPLKTSLFKKEIIKQDLRITGWISLVYLAGLLFILPLQILMEVSKNDDPFFQTAQKGLFTTSYGMQYFLLLSVPILMAIFLLRYVQVKNSSDFIHSLPVKRVQLFVLHVVTGFVLLMIPVIITGIVLLLMQAGVDVSIYYSTSDVWHWMGVIFLYTTLLYIAGIFVGTLTGLSLVQGGLTYIFLFLPTGLIFLTADNLQIYLKGFTSEFIFNYQISHLSPITRLLYAEHGDITGIDILLYGLISVALFFLSLYFYQKRPIETASQALAYPKLKPFFKYGVAACFALLAGSFFWSSQSSYGWLTFGYIVGSLIGYLLAEMLLHKSWRIFGLQHFKGYAYFLAAGVLIILIVNWDPLGYETKIPQQKNIEQVFLDGSSYRYKKDDEEKYLTDSKTIEDVRKLQKHLINNAVPKGEGDRTLFIAYELDNGSKVIRSYEYKYDHSLDPYLKPIYESLDYKQFTEPFLQMTTSNLDEITIYPVGPRNTGIHIKDPEQIEEYLTRFKKELIDESYSSMQSPPANSSHVLGKKNGKVVGSATIPPTFEHTVNWLKEHGKYDDAFTTPDEISSIKIIKVRDSMKWEERSRIFESGQWESEAGKKVIDKAQIRQLLPLTKQLVYHSSYPYLVQIQYSDSPSANSEVYGLESDEVPDFVKKYFN
ncbi:DUF6449 domain-containing protein [Halobacillus rhizosphaerae]|uniref:hypothetical protein n=1 Tax=Halobacillus rhizosphaerae TaxID=3064889 RepID=UPI00398AD13B